MRQAGEGGQNVQAQGLTTRGTSERQGARSLELGSSGLGTARSGAAGEKIIFIHQPMRNSSRTSNYYGEMEWMI